MAYAEGGMVYVGGSVLGMNDLWEQVALRVLGVCLGFTSSLEVGGGVSSAPAQAQNSGGNIKQRHQRERGLMTTPPQPLPSPPNQELKKESIRLQNEKARQASDLALAIAVLEAVGVLPKEVSEHLLYDNTPHAHVACLGITRW